MWRRNWDKNARFAEIGEEMQDLQKLPKKCNFCRNRRRNATFAEIAEEMQNPPRT
jgi:hypothetical protein